MAIVKKYKGHNVPSGATHYSDGDAFHEEGFYKIEGVRTLFSGVQAKYKEWSETTGVRRGNLLPQEPDQFMPKVGEECEYNVEQPHLAPCFNKVTVIAIIGKRIYFYDNTDDLQENGGREIYNTVKYLDHFRPIKTEREKVIEWAYEATSSYGTILDGVLGTLFDLGALTIPESK